jgi:hypothetical protein
MGASREILYFSSVPQPARLWGLAQDLKSLKEQQDHGETDQKSEKIQSRQTAREQPRAQGEE